MVNEPAKPEAGKVAAAKVETTKVAAMPKALGAAGGAVSAKSAMAADAMTARRDSGMAGAAAMAAAAAPTAKGLSLQNVVVTGVSERQRAASAEVTATTAVELGRVPVCFDSYQSAAEFTGAAANAVKTRFAPAPLMLDTTPASFGTSAMADQPAGGAFRQLARFRWRGGFVGAARPGFDRTANWRAENAGVGDRRRAERRRTNAGAAGVRGGEAVGLQTSDLSVRRGAPGESSR